MASAIIATLALAMGLGSQRVIWNLMVITMYSFSKSNPELEAFDALTGKISQKMIMLF